MATNALPWLFECPNCPGVMLTAHWYTGHRGDGSTPAICEECHAEWQADADGDEGMRLTDVADYEDDTENDDE